LRRLLVMLPWLMERGSASVAEIAERFDLSEAHVIADLERASLCGLPPYVDEMIDLYIEDGIVHVGVPRLFTRPLRLTPSEAFSLLAAGRAALELPGADPAGPLATALEKLAASLGDAASSAVAVDLDRPPMLDMVQQAVATGSRLLITYWSASSDQLSERTIDPHATFAERRHWYVVADDSRRGPERTFRIDRIESATATGDHFDRRQVATPLDRGWFAGEDDPPAVLTVPADSAWVVERYPVQTVETLPDGRLRLTLAIASERWLARLLIRLGAGARLEQPPTLQPLAGETARAVLARYS
jgi:proteasome accessory factor C